MRNRRKLQGGRQMRAGAANPPEQASLEPTALKPAQGAVMGGLILGVAVLGRAAVYPTHPWQEAPISRASCEIRCFYVKLSTGAHQPSLPNLVVTHIP